MSKVPKETSVYPTEPVHNKYTIGFAKELTDLLKSGEKVKTYRFGDKYDYLTEGDVLTVIETQEGKEPQFIGKARIVGKEKTSFTELPLETSGHESYGDKDHQRRVFSGYYAYLGREIKDDDIFLVFEFKLIKS